SEDALSIKSQLPPFVSTVGVFVSQDIEELRTVKEEVGFDVFQLHGDESPDYCRKLGGNIIKAFRVKNEPNYNNIESYPVNAVLFDTYSTVEYGGAGISFDWDLLKDIDLSKRVILSGGLTPQNVAEAIKIVKPYAVDVSSGIEEYTGKKNPVKLKKFIEIVRNGD
ncbi:MAG: N-(5'-phosphoribosyl)anthranilate isomerase, partial [Thermodesulfobacteriota bacterium]